MYEVDPFMQKDEVTLRTYIAKNPFSTLIADTGDEMCVDHIPLEFDDSVGSTGRLIGHIAKSNPLWRNAESAREDSIFARAIFCGHQAYVSPDWYPSKLAEPRVVPTWNYAAVHVSGRLRFSHDPDLIRSILDRLTDRFESVRPRPWRVDDAPKDFLTKMVSGVVGIELEIESMIGKWKLSQNRSQEDRAGVRDGLRNEAGAMGEGLADLMAEGESDSLV